MLHVTNMAFISDEIKLNYKQVILNYCWLLMQSESEDSAKGFESYQSFNDRFQSNTSIDRFALRSVSPSLNRHLTLVDAMDIEMPDRKSDLYDSVLGEGARYSNYKRNSSLSNGDFRISFERDSGACTNKNISEFPMTEDQKEQHLRSTVQRSIHECTCDNQCNLQNCVCFLFSDELCISGLCCESCVKYKLQLMGAPALTIPKQSTGCLCKNIKCLKMYCSCYRNGKKCDKEICKCEGCENNADGLLEKKRHKQNQNQKKVVLVRGNYHLGRDGIKKKIVLERTSDSNNCACQKSNCLKKYCLCYSKGRHCNESCGCKDCSNKPSDQGSDADSQKKARIARYARCQQECSESDDNNDIDRYLEQEEDYRYQQFNEHMEFEPVDFSNVES